MRNLKFRYSAIAVLAGVSFLWACTNHNPDDLPKPEPVVLSDCDTVNVTYAGSIKPIIETNCALKDCHITGNGFLPELGIYSTLKTFATTNSTKSPGYTQLIARIKHISTEGSGMPFGKPKLSDCDIRKIELWVKAGAPNN